MTAAHAPCPQCGELLNSSSLSGLCPRCTALDIFGGAPLEPEVLAPATSAAALRLGDYELIEEIARGGMGVVYRARQVSLGREVAVKTIVSGLLAGDEAIARFKSEAAAAAGLRHPHIVAVHEIGEAEGLQFFSMEYVAGRSLSDLLRDGPLAAPRAAELMAKIARAVAYAHERGVVHRDLKPSNVLVDAAGEPRISDFGLAKRLDSLSDLTLTGQVLGTPGYMAPEMASGGSRHSGTAVDVYGLGALLFHVLTSRAPFIGENATAILRQLEESDPITPRLLNPSVPRDLETICLKALNREPQRRFGSAQAMADDLDRFLDGRPVLSRPTSGLEKIWRRAKRHPALTAALAACVLSVAGGVSGILWQLRQTEIARGDAVKRATEKEEQRQLAENARREAEVAQREAESSAEARRVSLYAADMPQVQRALAENDFYQARLLLEAHRPTAGQTDLRGWEWRRFWQESRGDEFASRDSGREGVTGVIFSADGAHLAVCSRKATIWDAATLSLQKASPDIALTSIAFSPDGGTLYLGEVAPRVMRWRWQEEAAPTELCRRPAGFVRVAVSPTGDVLAVGSGTRQSGSPDGSVALYDAATGEVRRKLPEAGGFAAFSPDGTLLATGSWRDAVKLWDPLTGEVRRTLTGLQGVTSLRFSADGRQLVVSRSSGECRIFDVATGEAHNGTSGYEANVWDAALSPDGSQLATVSLDQSVRLWDAATGQQIAKFLGHVRGVGQIAWAADGRNVATGGADGTVKFWRPEDLARSSERLPGRTARQLFSPDGQWLVLKMPDTAISVYAYPSMKQGGTAFVGEALGFLPHSNTLLSYGRFGTSGEPRSVRRWSVPDLKAGETIPLPESETEPHQVRLSADGRWLAGFTAAGKARVWDLAEGGRVMDMRKQISHPVVSLEVLPDPPILVAGCAIGPFLRLYSLPSGKYLDILGYSGGAPLFMLPDADGKSLFVASGNSVIRKWDVPTRRELWDFAENNGPMDVSPDGLTLACAANNSGHPVRLWNLATRREVARIKTERRVANVAFAPDGSALLLTESGSGLPESTLIMRAPGFEKTDDPTANSLTK